jgi:hypothetical protein
MPAITIIYDSNSAAATIKEGVLREHASWALLRDTILHDGYRTTGFVALLRGHLAFTASASSACRWCRTASCLRARALHSIATCGRDAVLRTATGHARRACVAATWVPSLIIIIRDQPNLVIVRATPTSALGRPRSSLEVANRLHRLLPFFDQLPIRVVERDVRLDRAIDEVAHAETVRVSNLPSKVRGRGVDRQHLGGRVPQLGPDFYVFEFWHLDYPRTEPKLEP